MKRIHHWIDGRLTPGTGERRGPVYNPATGAQTGEVDFATAAEVDAAVASAREAFGFWREVPVSRRSEILFRYRELVERHRNDIARLLTAEHGKVLADAAGEVSRGLENIEFACGVGQLLKGEHTEQASTGVDVYSIRQPLGVVAGITPFNFPAMVPMWMYPNAIACGNTFVLKPSEKDPSAPLFTMELLADAGLPPGVVNLVQGDRVAVDRLLTHPDVAAVSFVGSTPVARAIYETGTRNGKRVQALGGAKNHMVVLPDADVELGRRRRRERPPTGPPVSAAWPSPRSWPWAAWPNRWSPPSTPAWTRSASATASRTPTPRWGRSSPPSTATGWPATSTAGGPKVRWSCATAAPTPPTSTVGSSACRCWITSRRTWPAIATRSSARCSASCGSTATTRRSVSSTRTPGATGPPSSPATAARPGASSSRQERGWWASTCRPVPVSYYSFGGWKGSLFGDTHMYGPEGIHFYTRAKVVTSRWPDPATSTVDLGFPRNR